MSDKLNLDIVTPQGSVFHGEVDEVTATGSEGEFGVVPGHAPMLTTLKSGMLHFKQGAEASHFFVSWGYAEVGPDKVTILADSAERSAAIDIERARQAKAKAEEELRNADDTKFAMAEAALERAIMRIHVAEQYGDKK